jgi:hypothetical protein
MWLRLKVSADSSRCSRDGGIALTPPMQNVLEMKVEDVVGGAPNPIINGRLRFPFLPISIEHNKDIYLNLLKTN